MPLTIDIERLWDQKYRDASVPFPVAGTPSGTAAVSTDAIWDAKGDLAIGTGADTAQKLVVGTNGQVLTADSTQPTGVKWAAVAGGGGAVIATDTLWDAKGDLAVGTGADAAQKLVVGTNGQVLTADSTQPTGIKWAAAGSGSVAADVIWDTKGDLAVGTGADTAAKLVAGTNGQVLTADSTQTTGLKWAAVGAGSASAAALRWFDTKDYGAKSDLTRADNADTTASNTTILGTTFSGTATDAGKLIRIQAAGANLFTGTANGNMSAASLATQNRFTCSAVTFDQTVVGRYLTIMSGSTVTLRAKILGVESATQLRLNAPSPGAVTNQDWFIAEDHYTTIATSTAGVSAVLTVAPVRSTKNAIIYYGTDDATAIQAAVTDAELFANLGGGGNVVYHFGRSMIGTPIYLQKPTEFIGAGSHGYSSTLAIGRAVLMLGAPKIRGIVAGGTDTGMGVNGSITSGANILTDPEANFQVGDVGKNIIIYGAGTQTGSSTGFFLNGVIHARTNATTVTIYDPTNSTPLNAGTTLAGGGIYSYSSTAGYNGGLVGPQVKNVHIIGGPGQRAGLHLMNISACVQEEVTASDFGSGVALFNDPGPSAAGFTNEVEFRSCYGIDSRYGIKSERGVIELTGECLFDGNSNRADCNVPIGMTIGVDGNYIQNGGWVTVQAYGTCVRSAGRGGGAGVYGTGWDFEIMSLIFDLQSDGVNGGLNNYIGFSSAGNSNAGGGSGLRMGAGARARFLPGFYLDADLDMYGLVDANAHLSVLGQTVEKSGVIGDSDFANTPYDGAQGYDSLNGRLQVRVGGNWRVLTTTGIANRVKKLGATSSISGVTTLTITCVGSVPAGHHVIVPITYGLGSTPTVTVADSKGNTYNLDVHADLLTGATPHAAVASAKVATPLVGGVDTITVTWGSAPGVNAFGAYEYAGLAAASHLDKTAGATGTSTGPSSGATATTAQASEVLVGVICAGNAPTWTPGTGFTTIEEFDISGAKIYAAEDEIVLSTGAYAATGTLGTSQDWAAVIATYKAA